MMSIAEVNAWHSVHVDFVQAFPQAPVERTLYMDIPKGYEMQGSTKEYCLQILKNIYGQVQAGKVWKDYLTNKLSKIGFKVSDYYKCVLTKGKVIYVLYTDDLILMGPSLEEIQAYITKMSESGLKITQEGSIEEFLDI